MYRLGLTLLLLVGAARAGPVEDLASRSAPRRAAARAKLLAQGESAWPALETALRGPDTEVARAAREILRAWDWFPASLRGIADLDALRSSDPRQRAAAFGEIEAKGQRGKHVLRRLFGRAPASFAIEPVFTRRTYPESWLTGLGFRLRNRDVSPGWAPPGLMVRDARHRPFGRVVHFPGLRAPRPMGVWQRLSCMRLVQTTFVSESEWVPPGQATRSTKTAFTALAPGATTMVVTASTPRYPAHAAAVQISANEQLISVRNEFDFDVWTDCRAFELTLYALPARTLWGVRRNGTRLRADLDGRRLRIRIDSQFAAFVPGDLGSGWYAALDCRGEVVAHGPLDGGDVEPRRYTPDDLVRIPEQVSLTRHFVRPRLPTSAVQLLCGVSVAATRRKGSLADPHGYLVLSEPVKLR